MSTTIDSPSLPSWFTVLNEESAVQYKSLANPSRKMENWRFGSLKKADISAFSPAQPLVVTDDLDCSQLESTAAKFVFANNELISSEVGDLPDGVICMPLTEALVSHEALVQQHLLRSEVKLGSEKAAAFHIANVRSGVFVFVPAGVKLEAPVEVYHWAGGDHSTVFPHTLVVAEKDSAVKVVDYFQSADEAMTLTLAMNDLVAGEGSALDYVCIQNVNDVSKVIQINATDVAASARSRALMLNIGADWARNEAYSSLTGEGAHSDMLSVNIPFGQQEYDQRTFQHHKARGAYSDLLYKNSLYDKSKTVFSGLIFVDEGAHDTDAYQTCRNLFMSDDAEANSMPGLEINADQVKCSHGSTSSQVSEEEIFYLQARGISAREAKQMIARGFSVDVIQRLEDEALEGMILRFIDGKFRKELA